MPGLVPGICVFKAAKTWMAGTTSAIHIQETAFTKQKRAA
jgi:hypothetical protein